MEKPFYGLPVAIKGENPGPTWRHNNNAERRARKNWPKDYDHDLMLTVETTDQCTLRCDHCFAESGPEKNTFISHKKIEDVAKECEVIFPHYREKSIRITGGDPFLHPKIFEIIKSFSKRKKKLGYYSIDVESNGWWAKDDKTARRYIRKLKESGADLLSVTNDYFHCKQGVFDLNEHMSRIGRISAEEGLRFRNILTGWGPDPDEKTAKEMEEHKKSCGSCTGLPHITPIGRARNLPEKLWASPFDSSRVRGCRLSPPTFLPEVGSERYAHRNEITLGPDGNVYPCNSGKEFEHASLAIGNVYKKSLAHIIQNPENPIVDIIRNEGLRGISRRAGITSPNHWAAYWKMSPCGLCHELLRTRGKQIQKKIK
jgi:MoaA/NifB/PqqE/SkfB family radical SAM enzyme